MPVHSTQYLSDSITYGSLHSYLLTEGPSITHWIEGGVDIDVDDSKL
jgi:hypothetical protein